MLGLLEFRTDALPDLREKVAPALVRMEAPDLIGLDREEWVVARGAQQLFQRWVGRKLGANASAGAASNILNLLFSFSSSSNIAATFPQR